jgi:hypothetical protein
MADVAAIEDAGLGLGCFNSILANSIAAKKRTRPTVCMFSRMRCLIGVTRGLSPSSEHDMIRCPHRLKQYLDICFNLRAPQVIVLARDPIFGRWMVSQDTFDSPFGRDS